MLPDLLGLEHGVFVCLCVCVCTGVYRCVCVGGVSVCVCVCWFGSVFALDILCERRCLFRCYSITSQSLSGWWLGSMAIQNAESNSSSPPFTQALGAMMVILGFFWVALAIFDGLIVFRVCLYTQWRAWQGCLMRL